MFFFLETADGSPSLRIGRVDRETESMHSWRGAFSETDYIYGDAMRWVLDRGADLKLLSVGLGLGYVEILATAVGLSAARAVYVESYEAVPELIENFKAWASGSGPESSNFGEAYDKILRLTAARYGLADDDIKSAMKASLAEGRFQIHGALTTSTDFISKSNCIAFDAFSSKTDPELWTPEFLGDFFARACDPTCVVSTYACTGNLKRALVANNFTLAIRDGYASKRQSTFATRGLQA